MPDPEAAKPDAPVLRRFLFRFPILAIGCITVVCIFAFAWNRYAQNRTTTIRFVRQGLIYMQDGTVWRVYGEVYALAGDRVRYESLGDGQSRCVLVDTATGWFRAGSRVSSPFDHTSCPSTSATSRVLKTMSRMWRRDLQPEHGALLVSPDEVSGVPAVRPSPSHQEGAENVKWIAGYVPFLVPLCALALMAFWLTTKRPRSLTKTGSSDQAARSLRGVDGWLLFLCASLTIGGPVGAIILAHANPSPARLILGAVAAAFSVYVGKAIWNVKPNALKLVRSYLLVSAFIGLVLLLVMPSAHTFAQLVVTAAWWMYFRDSRRVGATLGSNLRGIFSDTPGLPD